MPAYRAPRARGSRVRAITEGRYAVPLGLGALMLLSLVLRILAFTVGYWIDEGISVGIADRPLLDIFDALRQDGSPPLYYLILHFWLPVAGDSEPATHALSLLFALIAIPVAWWGGRAVFSDRAGWTAAALTAANPFLTQYAQETRMYALVILLGIVACVTFLRVFAIPTDDEAPGRGWLAGLALSLAALLYTHNWAMFFIAATLLAWLGLFWLVSPVRRRRMLRDAVVAYGAALLLYVPWIPTMLHQTAHTGAPWALRPDLAALGSVPYRLMGGPALVALLLAAGAGIVVVTAAGGSLRRLTASGRATVVLAVLFVGTVAIAWLVSQASPAWANRYLAVGLPPLLLFAAAGLAHAGRLGVVGLLLVMALWAARGAPDDKSNVRDVTQHISPSLAPGDVVVSTQPEQIPVLHHYLPDGLRYWTVWGPVSDLGVADWRDGVAHLEATSARRDLEPLMDSMPVGRRLALIRPTLFSAQRWNAPWTSLIRQRTQEWGQYALDDPRFQIASIYPSGGPKRPSSVQATILVKTRR
jgi:hypothetical protein